MGRGRAVVSTRTHTSTFAIACLLTYVDIWRLAHKHIWLVGV